MGGRRKDQNNIATVLELIHQIVQCMRAHKHSSPALECEGAAADDDDDGTNCWYSASAGWYSQHNYIM